MKSLSAVVVGAVVVLGLACSGDRSQSSELELPEARPTVPAEESPGVAPGAGEAAVGPVGEPVVEAPGDAVREEVLPAPAPGLAELRLRGIGTEGLEAAYGRVSEVVVTVDGKQVPFLQRAQTFDLAYASHAWLVGRFSLPVDARQVEVTLRFDDFGAYEGAAGAGYLDFRAAPVRFSGPASSFSENGHAVIRLDLASSMKPFRNGMLVLPSFQVHY